MKRFFNNISVNSKEFEQHVAREAKKHSAKHKRKTTRSKSALMSHFFDKISSEYFTEVKSVLCVGCRDEIEIQMFEDNNIAGTGIDPAIETPKIKKVPAEKMLEVFNEKEFDIVYSSHSLEHVAIPEVVLRNIRIVSKKGCYVILPLEERKRPGNDHPNIFDISKKSSNATKEELIECLSVDFKSFEPYEVKDVFYYEYKDKNYEPEFHICFEWID
jgi:SAM-dependent methyltransferase|tara:strand:- start:4725 stop:5372 length:648 start_codon:yes stop_codon:yes gene_type:complete